MIYWITCDAYLSSFDGNSLKVEFRQIREQNVKFGSVLHCGFIIMEHISGKNYKICLTYSPVLV